MTAFKFLIIALSLATASGTRLSCKYELNFLPGSRTRDYMCTGDMTTTRADYLIDEVSGTHIDGSKDEDVTAVEFKDKTMEVLPRNLRTFLRNYRALSIFGNEKLPNLKRSDFYDFTGLAFFSANNISSITKLPRDTFFDMTKLDSLYLESNRNMESLHEDLLVNLRRLRVFSAKGPNKIDQINPGFFRNQMDSLETVDFRATNLVRVGHSVFVNLQVFVVGRFDDATGCITGLQSPQTLTTDVRAQCQDVIL